MQALVIFLEMCRLRLDKHPLVCLPAQLANRPQRNNSIAPLIASSRRKSKSNPQLIKPGVRNQIKFRRSGDTARRGGYSCPRWKLGFICMWSYIMDH